jgi:HD-GYP domain-containing protein (c-di-GMP phosphodiesterase class II)
VAVADALEALTSARPQRPAYQPEEAAELVKSESGILYDPEIVTVLPLG